MLFLFLYLLLVQSNYLLKAKVNKVALVNAVLEDRRSRVIDGVTFKFLEGF